MVSFPTHFLDIQAFLPSAQWLYFIHLLGHCHFYPGSQSLEKTLLSSLTLSLQLQNPQGTPRIRHPKNASTEGFSALLGGGFSILLAQAWLGAETCCLNFPVLFPGDKSPWPELPCLQSGDS